MKKLLAILTIGVVGALVFAFAFFAHHHFVTGLNPFLGTVFLFVFILIAVLLLGRGFRWVQRRWVEDVRYMPAVLFAGGGIGWAIGGLLFGAQSSSTLDIQLHDTLFVIAHPHVGLLMMIFLLLIAGVYLLIFRSYASLWLRVFSYVHFAVTYIGCYIVFWTTRMLMAGMPRRYFDYSGWSSYVDLERYNWPLTVVVAVQAVFVGVVVYALVKRFFVR